MAEPKVLGKKQPKSARKALNITAQIPGARAVCVTGNFTEWSEKGIPMTNGSGDLWEAELRLAPGEYEYRLRVDGEWRDHAEARKRVPNPFGTENCVLTVDGEVN